MKRFQKVYLEITNVCNLHCRFCPGTRRTPMRISEEAFRLILKKLCSYTNFLYFHVMGEPLCHPDLSQFLKLAQDYGFRVILTTNGTLLSQKRDILLNAPALHKSTSPSTLLRPTIWICPFLIIWMVASHSEKPPGVVRWWYTDSGTGAVRTR